MRQSLLLSKRTRVSLEEEIQITQNYIDLELLRFPENLTITLINEVETDRYMVPPLIIQPFIENALKHGILPSKKAVGVIDIRIKEENNTLFIFIEDNGVGFDKPLNFSNWKIRIPEMKYFWMQISQKLLLY